MYVPCYIHNLKTIKKKKGKGYLPTTLLSRESFGRSRSKEAFCGFLSS
jgi:hypothetical protein